MICSQCGAKLAETARFCSACGAPVSVSEASGLDEGGSLAGDNGGGLAEDPSPGAVREQDGFVRRLIAFRQTTLRAVPTFVLAIFAFLAAAGTAYAAYKVVTEVVMPAIERLRDSAQPAEPESGHSAESQESAENKLAHTAYEGVLDDYRRLFAEQADVIAASDEIGTMIQNDHALAWTGDFFFSPGTDGVKYTYLDLDEDGVDELLITVDDGRPAEEGRVADLVLCAFGYVDGEAVRFAESIVRGSYWLNKDGSVGYFGSGGFDTGRYVVYRWNGRELDPATSMAWTYADLDDRGNPTSPYRLDILVDGEESQEIVTYEDCLARVESYRAEHQDYADVDWRGLAE